jgi:RNase adapter protein RapZ
MKADMTAEVKIGNDDTGEMAAVGAAPELGELVVVTGMTGAGRSTAAKELEDLGYFVVDNLPPELVTAVVRLVDEQKGRDQPIAVVVDVRGGTSFHTLREQLAKHLPTRRTSLLFLEADDDILVRRQEAARRPHPLQAGGRLLEGIDRERSVMTQLRGDADVVIDTTQLNLHQLKDKVAQAFGDPGTTALKVTVVSFGFKYGVPVDADLLADMRFLPNPFWVAELRDFTGQDPDVVEYVTGRADAQTFLERYVPVVETVGEGYLREGKRFMTVAIGCTGGKHRSVAMAEEIASRLRALGMDATSTHRDLGRE